jgi:hypothetical protein
MDEVYSNSLTNCDHNVYIDFCICNNMDQNTRLRMVKDSYICLDCEYVNNSTLIEID